MDRPLSFKIIQKHAPAKLPQPKPVELNLLPSIPKSAEPKLNQPIVKTPVLSITKPKKIKQDLIQKQLLADLKKQTQREKNSKQKAVQAAFEKEMNEIKEKSLEQQMLQEQKRLASIMTQQTQGVVDKYKALILQTISRHWLIPANIDKHLTAELLIRVAPGGTFQVQLIKSSGVKAGSFHVQPF